MGFIFGGIDILSGTPSYVLAKKLKALKGDII